MNLKKQIMKQMVKVKVVHSMPGRLRLKLTYPGNTPGSLKPYEHYVEKALMLLPGIGSASCNALLGTVLLEYDASKTSEEKIIQWINTIITIGIDQSAFISTNSKDNLPHVEQALERLLREGLDSL